MDRFSRGLIAGATGGIAMNLWTVFAVYVLRLDIIRFIDWASIILYGNLPGTHLEAAFALLMQILWAALLGVALALLIGQVTSRIYYVKGAFFGIIAGFIIYAIPTVLQMPILGRTSFTTVVSNHTGGLIWGLVTAKMLHWLDKRAGNRKMI
jgi:hypothetical protein